MLSALGARRKAAIRAAITQRRRIIIGAAAIADSETLPNGPQGLKVDAVKERFGWERHVQKLPERKFISKYALDKEGFAELAGTLRDDITCRNPGMALCSSAGAIQAEVRLAVGLRWLRGGAYQDLEEIYKMGTNEIYESCWQTIDAVSKNVKVEFDMSDVDLLKRLEVLNALKSPKHCWRGQVAWTDFIGTII